MITAVTSISPSHINKDCQQRAIDSWNELGMEVYSMNCKNEIEILKELYTGVTFIETVRTGEVMFGKPYVMINSVIDWFKDSGKDNLCIINSDIELKTKAKEINKLEQYMAQGIVMCNRMDHNGNYLGVKYLIGIDVFFINKKYAAIYNQSVYCFGQCFWDYWIPFTANKAGVPVMMIENNIAYHLSHPAQYNHDQWRKIGKYFTWESGLVQFADVGRLSNYVYNYIYNNLTKITL